MDTKNNINKKQTPSTQLSSQPASLAVLLLKLFNLSRDASKTSKGSVYGEFVQLIQSFLGIASVTLCQYSQKDGMFRYVAIAAHSSKLKAAYEKRKGVQHGQPSVRKKTIVSDQQTYFPDTAETEHKELFIPGIKSSFCVPIVTDFGERWALCADHTLRDGIPPADQDVIILCSQIGRNLIESLQSRYFFYRMNKAYQEVLSLSMLASVEAVCAAIANVIVETIGAHACSVILKPDENSADLVLVAEYNVKRILPDGKRLTFELKTGQGIAGLVIEQGKPIFVYDLGDDQRFADRDLIKINEFGSLLSMPLFTKDKTFGAVSYFTHRDDKHSFSSSERTYLRTLVGLCGMACGLAVTQREVLDSLECGVCILDTEFRLVFANRYQRELFPEVDREMMTPMDARSRKCYMLYNPDSTFTKKCPWCPVDKVLQDGMPHALITHADARDHHMGHYYTAAASLTSENGVITSVMEMVTDVTAQVEQLVLSFLMVAEDDWRRLLDLAADSLCRLSRADGCVVLTASMESQILQVYNIYRPEGRDQFVKEIEFLLGIPPEQFMHRIANYAQGRGLQFKRFDDSLDIAILRSEFYAMLGSENPPERTVTIPWVRFAEAKSMEDIFTLFSAHSATVVCATEISPSIYFILVNSKESSPDTLEVAMESVDAVGDIIVAAMTAIHARYTTQKLARSLETVTRSIDELMIGLHSKDEQELMRVIVQIVLEALHPSFALLALSDEAGNLVIKSSSVGWTDRQKGGQGTDTELMRILERAYATKSPFLWRGVADDENFGESNTQVGNVPAGFGNYSSAVAVPLVDQDGSAIGALGVAFCSTNQLEVEFEDISQDSSADMLRLIADAYVASITNLRIHKELSYAKDKLDVHWAEISSQIGRANFWAWTQKVNHEVKNLLFDVQLELKELCETGRFPSREMGILHRGLKRTERVREQIKDVLALWRDEKADRWSQDVNDLVRQGILLNEHYRTQALKAVEIDYSDLSKKLPEVSVAPAEIVLTVYNLLTNAIHSIEQTDRKEGHIWVRTRYERGFVIIEVEDNGTGIPNEFVDRIFEPDFTMSEDGSGLGLFIVSEVAKSIGGSAFVLQHTVGKGSTFVVQLPAVGKVKERRV